MCSAWCIGIDRVLDRLAIGAHGLEGMATEKDGDQPGQRQEEHEDDHRIGNLATDTLDKADKRSVACRFVHGWTSPG
jgi:hypothetical protein